MSDDVETATLEILKRIQMDIADLKVRMDGGFARVDEQMRLARRDSAGMLVMMRATAGDFDERVREVEERVEAPGRRGAGS